MKMRRIGVPFQFKAAADGRPAVGGYGSVFGTVDSYGDVIAPGAFGASLARHAEKGTMPAMLWQHNSDWPVGRWTEVSEDETGLRVAGELADTQLGRDASALLRMGAITGASIGFVTRKAEMDQETGVRTLTELDLWEVSLVTFPANEDARVEARAADIAQMSVTEIERLLRDADLSRRESKTLISRLMSIGAARDAQAAKDSARLMAGLGRLARVLS